MKHNKFIFGVLSLIILTTLCSCSSNSDLLRKESNSKKTCILLHMAEMDGANDSDDLQSRYGITGSTSSWRGYFENAVNTTDTMGLFPSGGYQIPFVVPITPGTTATDVTVTADGWTTKKSVTYAIYLPFNFYNRDYSAIEWDLRKVPLQMDNTDHVEALKMMLVASDTCQATSGATGDTLKTKLYMKGSVLQIRARMTSFPQSTKYVRMMLASGYPDQFTVYGKMNLFANNPVTTANYNSYGADQILTPIIQTDHIMVDLNHVEKDPSTNYVVGYFTVAPTDFSTRTLYLYLWDEDGNIYSGSMTRTGSTIIGRHTFKNYNFTNMATFTGTLPRLNPWEEGDLCPTCNPVAF